MGRPIVYCDSCGKILREEDFSRGKAHEVDHRNFCSDCRPVPIPPPVSSTPSGGFKKISSTRIPAASGRPPSKASHAPVPPAPRTVSKQGLLAVGLGLGALLVVGVIVAVSSSGAKPAVEEEVRMKPATRPTADAPRTAASEESLREPLRKALQHQRQFPNDIGGQIREFTAAVQAVGGTTHEADAKRQLSAVHERVRKELAEVESQASPYAAGEEFGKSLNVLEAARRRYDHIDWIRGVNAVVSRVRTALETARVDVRGKLAAARARNAEDEIARLASRVARWELPGEDAALLPPTAAPAPAPTPAPAPEPPPPVADPFAPRRAQALAAVAARDYDAALAALGTEPGLKEDVDFLRAAQTALLEGTALLLRAPRGKKQVVEFRDPTGAPAKVDDVLLRADATRIEMKFGADSLVIPIGEVAARTIAEAWKARPNAKPEDARGADALCWLEGDLEGLPLPARLKGTPPPADEEARRAFYDAEVLYFDPARNPDALELYRGLLGEHAATAFVRRNRAAIQARLEPLKELVFAGEELKGAGGFKLVPNKRMERCWTSEKDLDPGTSKGNYVELSFPAAPERPLKAFALVGGCCAETFTFHLQATDLKTPDGKAGAGPGEDAAVPVKHTITGLKRRHGDHLGPKAPERWEWVTLPLPKFAEAGLKTLRLLSDQKGFSVALVALSADRTTPPRDLEPKDLERRRGEIPGYLSRGGVQLGSIVLEIWRGIGGGNVDSLRGHAAYPDRPTERTRLRVFESPKDVGDDYGARVRGYVHPPATGDYVFWIASDDNGELWLSTDDDPKTKVVIARQGEWTSPQEYEKRAEQKSMPLRLEAGRRYYIEALLKEGGGGDHVSVRWQLPDGKIEQPIPGARLSPWTGGRR